MNARLTLTPIFLSLSLLTSGCIDAGGEEGSSETGSEQQLPEWEELRSEIDHDQTPAASSAEWQQLSAGQYELSLALYAQWGDEEFADANFSVAAPNIQAAFGMVYEIVREDLRPEILEALSFDLDPARLHEVLNWQDHAFRDLNMDATEDADPVIVTPANGVWAQASEAGQSPLPDSYLDLLSEHYDIGIKLADFNREGGEYERERINEWVSYHTEELIPELLPMNSLADATMLLINALYIKAPWAVPFEEGATMDRDFQLADGTTVSVPTMHAYDLSAGILHEENYDAYTLPLRGGGLEMHFIVPTGDFAEFEGNMSAELLTHAIEAQSWTSAAIFLPKFEFFSQSSLKRALESLGLTGVWAPNWDATLIGAFLDVIHGTNFAVDEKGIEAAAATVIIIGEDGGGGPSETVTIDRPFIFVLRDANTDSPIFLGRVLDPRQN